MNNKNYDIAVKDISHYFITAKNEDDALEQALIAHNGGDTLGVELEVKGIICSECENVFSEDQGGFKKYSEDTWVCDDCHDQLMEE